MRTGPPMLNPGWLSFPDDCWGAPGLMVPLAIPAWYASRVKCGAPFQRYFCAWSNPDPWYVVLPDFVVTLTYTPEVCPSEASNGEVSMRTSPTASEEGTNPARPPLVPVTGSPSSRNSLPA